MFICLLRRVVPPTAFVLKRSPNRLSTLGSTTIPKEYFLRLRQWWSQWHPANWPQFGKGIMSTVIIGGSLYALESALFYCRISRVLKKGTRPEVPYIQHIIERKDVIKKIEDSYITDTHPGEFGAIIGPTGTGKSTITRQVCNLPSNRSGVLYVEVTNDECFPKKLFDAVGMKGSNDGFLTYIVGKIPGILKNHQLTGNFNKDVNMIFSTLEYVAKMCGYRRVTVFIDGSDVIAKFNREGFDKLVQLAKSLATQKTLQLVFVSSEGHVMPLINQSSCKARCRVLEVLDIEKKAAKNHLTQILKPLMDAKNEKIATKLAASIAEELVKVTGGRFLFMMVARRVYDEFKHERKETTKPIDINAVKGDLIFRLTSSSLEYLRKGDQHLLRAIIKELGFLSPKDWYSKFNDVELELELEQIRVNRLVVNNILRYSMKGLLTWHSELIKDEVMNSDWFK